MCLEAEGTCKADADVFFVTMNGADAGDCTRTAPCATFAFVLAKIAPTYKYIHLLGGSFHTASTIVLSSACYVDGTDTQINGANPVIHVNNPLGGTVLSNVTVIGPNTGDPAVTLDSNSTLTVYNSTINRGIKMSQAELIARRSSFTGPNVIPPGIDCTNGKVTVEDSTFSTSYISSTTCDVALRRDHFAGTGQCFGISNGTAVIENNVFERSYELDDCGSVMGLAPASTIRFNTFVNTSQVAADGRALDCDNTGSVSSNIFAWGSSAPHGPSLCAPTYSLYDEADTTPVGSTDLRAAGTTFFVNKAGSDFHLAAGSPAIGKAESNTGVVVDFDGHPRPATGPDIGAFEAP